MNRTVKKISVFTIVLMSMIMWTSVAQAQCTFQMVSGLNLTPEYFCTTTCSPQQVIIYRPVGTFTGTEWDLSAPSETRYGDSIILYPSDNGRIISWVSNTLSVSIIFYFQSPLAGLSWADTSYTCGVLDAGLNVGGSYLWNTGETTRTKTITAPGQYIVNRTNSCNTIGDTTNILWGSTPLAIGNDTTLCYGNLLSLNAGGGANWMWSNGANTQATSVDTTGTYSVMATMNGCVMSDTINVTFLSPAVQDISLVTIDTTNGNNRITWDSSQFGSATTANIYRELTTNNYVLVGTAAYSDAAWTDSVNSRHQAWRYKLSLTDTCGNEGAQSPYVQSIHCYVVPVIGGGFNVTWTPYLIEGVTDPVTQYNIYSGDQLNQLTYQTYVSGNVNTYTLSAFADSLYVVGAVLSSKAASDDALSNWVSESDVAGINESSGKYLKIFPNPVKDELRISTSESEFYNVPRC